MAKDRPCGRVRGSGLIAHNIIRGSVYYYIIRAIFVHLSGVCTIHSNDILFFSHLLPTSFRWSSRGKPLYQNENLATP